MAGATADGGALRCARACRCGLGFSSAGAARGTLSGRVGAGDTVRVGAGDAFTGVFSGRASCSGGIVFCCACGAGGVTAVGSPDVEEDAPGRADAAAPAIANMAGLTMIALIGPGWLTGCGRTS
ncbi:hypothetical protein ET1_04_00190 [Edwardsiella tarda ATCC 15947 = NBRC 105688]|nr:hypothetical protein ET1_04_00190 [Edwardsiella tarda ATCC 15947 = NBRC 105688]